jgi:hypothetical protein
MSVIPYLRFQQCQERRQQIVAELLRDLPPAIMKEDDVPAIDSTTTDQQKTKK